MNLIILGAIYKLSHIGNGICQIGNGTLASLATTIALLEIFLCLDIFRTFKKRIIVFEAEHFSHIGNIIDLSNNYS